MIGSSCTLMWFRQDLRLADNPALMAAIKRGCPVVPVYIWSPDEEGDWPLGAASLWWLHHSLTALDASLRERGSRLIVRHGPTLPALRQLMKETGADMVYWNRRYEPAIIQRDAEIQKVLPTESFNASLLIEPRELKPYRVFTPFWRACLGRLDGRARPPGAPSGRPGGPSLPGPSHWPKSLELDDLGLLPKIDWTAGLRAAWQPGEAGAQKQLRRFIRHAMVNYSTNRDRPDLVGTSRLSPHLHLGEISPRQVWIACQSKPEYLRQLIWREFAYHLLYHFPHTPDKPLRTEFEKFPWSKARTGLEEWKCGRTGYPFVDAGMRELWTTGWMHNRVRMVVASFLVKHLLIPWQEGARWFWDTLVDADLANNTLGWQWTAGCGADAAPYFRIFNPTMQSEKFDPDGVYVQKWGPEYGKLDYPRPVVDHRQARERALDAYDQIRK